MIKNESYSEEIKAHNLYYKLHNCLKISLTAPVQPNGDNLSVHTNNIILKLAKSIESGETWYDSSVEAWCDYFLERNSKSESDDTDEVEKALKGLGYTITPNSHVIVKPYGYYRWYISLDDEEIGIYDFDRHTFVD